MVTLLILSRFSIFFNVRFSSKFAGHRLLKIPPHFICVATLPCETLMSENERQSQTKLQGTVVTYLGCDEMFNNQVRKGLLLSLSVKKSFKISEYLA